MSERKSRRWTPDELSLLRRLAFDDEPLSAIAAALHRTVLAVRTKAAHERLNVREHRYSSPEAAKQPMIDGPSSLAPGPGDYVVLYERRHPYGTPRLCLIRLSDRLTPTLVRATFESAEEAGPRFEDEARLMSAVCSTRAFRSVDGRYTPLDDTVDDHDA